MAKFIITPHGRLQEWVAEEKGYFRQAGLEDYELRAHRLLTRDAQKSSAPAGANELPDNLHGAYQTYEQGREASISCACHWTVNMAASSSHGRLWGEAYSVSPCAIARTYWRISVTANCSTSTARTRSIASSPSRSMLLEPFCTSLLMVKISYG